MQSIPDNVRSLAREIRLVIFDVDGVLTDGRLYFDNQGGRVKPSTPKMD